MNNRVFPIVEINLTEGDDDFQRWPKSRQRAFKWAASERCLFMGNWPDSIVEEFPSLRNSHRVVESCSWTPTVLGDLNKWEEVMPAHYTSDVLVQGRAVWNVLEPVATNTKTLYIIDPYLFSFDDRGNTYSTGLEYLLEQKPSVFQAVMCRPKKKKLSLPLAIKAISKWLVERVGRATSVTIFFAPAGSIHDRFLGFCDSRSSPKWLSISIGYGLTALNDKNDKRTCVARIPSSQFDELWELSLSKSYTCITRDEGHADLGGEWYERPDFDGFVRVFHRHYSKKYTGGH